MTPTWVSSQTQAAPVFANYPALRAAYLAGRARIVTLGDSKNIGYFANAGTNTGAYALSPSKTIISEFNNAGVTAIDGTFGGSKGISGGIANVVAYDTRITNTSGWVIATQETLDGQFFQNTTTTTALTLAPTITYDRIDISFLRTTGIGTFTITHNGSIVATINQNAANSIGFSQISVPRGTFNLVINRVSGNCFTLPLIRLWDSTTPHVQVSQLGRSGRKVSDWLVATTHYDPRNFLNAIDFDLALIDLGSNDIQAGVSAATYKSNLQTLITLLLNKGAEVQLIATVPAGGAGLAYNISASYITALEELASENGLRPIINLHSQFSPFNAANYASDGVHPLAAFNVQIGQAIASTLLG